MTDLNGRRQAAIKRIRAKRAFGVHATIYVAVNLLLIAVWALGRGYFWPIWPILGWGCTTGPSFFRGRFRRTRFGAKWRKGPKPLGRLRTSAEALVGIMEGRPACSSAPV